MAARTQYMLLAWGLAFCLLAIPAGVLLSLCSGDWRWFLLSLPGIFLLSTLK